MVLGCTPAPAEKLACLLLVVGAGTNGLTDLSPDAVLGRAVARRAVRNYSMTVLVDGPGENEWTVMELVEAIAEEFFYRWAAPAGPLTSRLHCFQ